MFINGILGANLNISQNFQIYCTKMTKEVQKATKN